MKHISTFFITAVLFSGVMILTRCSDKETTFPIALNNVNACINAGVKDTAAWKTIRKADIESFFSQNGISFNFSNLKEVRLNTATVTLETPSGGNFSDIIVFDMYFRQFGTTGLGTKVAYLTAIADSSANVTLSSNYSELESFFALDSFQAGLHINRNPAIETKCVNGSISLNVKVKGE